MSDNHQRVIIVGSGPAGLTAAIYTARAGLEPLVFEGIQPGGQLTITTDIENFPGFENGISGPELMDTMRRQAERFGAKCFFKEITEVDLSQRPFILKSGDQVMSADSLIIATGASAKYIGIESEEKYKGYGVSACATCDGFFFKGLKVLVVGGGDSAMEEANYLTRFCSEVTVVHRRDQFRASKIMTERASGNPKIKFELNAVVQEVLGTAESGRKSVTGAILRNTKDGSLKEVGCDGIFVAIGHSPNTGIFKEFIDMDQTGYIKTQPGSTATNLEGVFAAGDCADKTYRQAITAAGTGCMAALEAEKYLESKGIR